MPIESLWQDDLTVLICMHRHLMVPDVTDPVAHVIKPTEKGIYPQEEIVQILGAKGSLVRKLVAGDYLPAREALIKQRCES